jgi:hypothetical protein
MVGGAEQQESVIKSLDKISKEKTTEWKLKEQFSQFKEQDNQPTGVASRRVSLPTSSQEPVQPRDQEQQAVQVQPIREPQVQTQELPIEPVAKSTIDDETRLRAMKFLTPGQPGSPKDAPGINPAAWSPELVKKYSATVNKPVVSTKPTVAATTVSKPTGTSMIAPAAAATRTASDDSTQLGGKSRPKLEVPSNIRFADARQQERFSQLNPRLQDSLRRIAQDSGLPLTVTSTIRTPEEQEELYQRWKRGEKGIHQPARKVGAHSGRAVDIDATQLRAIHDWLQKNDPTGEKYGVETGYSWKNIDPVHLELKRRQLKQQNTMRESSINKLIQEFQSLLEYGNTQDPYQQTTTPKSTTTQTIDAKTIQQQQKEKQEQQIDLTTAKSFMSGLETAAGSDLDVNAAASAVTKISDQQPLTGPEQSAISTLTPLIAKAAETPQTSSTLKSSLRTAAQLAKVGK